MRLRAGATLICAILATTAGVARAHSGVKSYSPKPGSTVPRALNAASVTFKGSILRGSLGVSGPRGKRYSVGKARLVNGKRTLQVGLRTLRKGRYTATWKAVHKDGHVNSRSWRFTVR